MRRVKRRGCARVSMCTGIDLLTQLDDLATQRHPGQHETPGFPWGLDFVYLLLGGGGRI